MTTLDPETIPKNKRHALGQLPMREYDRTHRIKPAEGFWGRKWEALQDWAEDVVARFSIYGDPPVYSNECFPLGG